MNTLTLYTHPLSRGRNVRWMLAECGADYTTVPIEFGAMMKSADYLAVNPMGKVPALRDGDTVITETAAIITHLAERFPEKRLIPAPGTPEHGEYHRWLCFALHLEYAVMDTWFAVPHSEERRRAIGYGDLNTASNTLRQQLAARPYLLGTQFSAVDLYTAGLLGWVYHQGQTLAPDAVFADYLERATARPAYAQAQALDDALLAEMQQTATAPANHR